MPRLTPPATLCPPVLPSSSRRIAIFFCLVALLSPGLAGAQTPAPAPGPPVPTTLTQPTIDPIYLYRAYDTVNLQWGDLPLGPVPVDDTVGTGVAAVEIDLVTPKPELLVYRGKTIDWYSLAAAGGSGSLTPKPPVTIKALLGVQAVGSNREDLVVANGADLWVLDLDVPTPAWASFTPAPTVTPKFLAAADVLGGPEHEVIASDGTSIVALDLSTPGPLAWANLPAPPSPPDAIASQDVGFTTNPADFGTYFPERRLVASLGDTLWLYDRAPDDGVTFWTDPHVLRYGLKTSAPVEPLTFNGSPLGDIIVPRPLATSGITFEQAAPTAILGTGATYDPAGDIHCPGVVFTDLDGDDLPDLYLVRAPGSTDPQGTANSLLRNNGPNAQGKVTFSEVPNADGAAHPGHGTGALAADFDRDGIRDLYVINFGEPNVLYKGSDAGYSDITAATDPTPAVSDDQAGLAMGCDFGQTEPACDLDLTLAAAAGDFNRDGWLDLYVGNQDCCAGSTDGQRDVLYLSNGLDGSNNLTFTDITYSAGIEVTQPAFNTSTMAVLVADFDNDGWPDIYVGNKSFGPPRDRLYLNDGDGGDNVWDGTFTEYFASQPDPRLGETTCEAMGVDAADYDHDGDLDIYVTDVSKDCLGFGHTDMELYRNRLVEDGAFGLELIEPNPVGAPGLNWGVSWADFDNDGRQDLHVSASGGTGNPIHYVNWIYRNTGSGFADVTVDSKALLSQDDRASVIADYDRDGRIDLLVASRQGQPLSLFHNVTRVNANRHWLAVKLVGDPTLAPSPFLSTTDAVGARVDVFDGTTWRRRDIYAGGHTCASTRDYILHFGVGSATTVDVEVLWPSGRATRLPGRPVDQLLVIQE